MRLVQNSSGIHPFNPNKASDYLSLLPSVCGCIAAAAGGGFVGYNIGRHHPAPAAIPGARSPAVTETVASKTKVSIEEARKPALREQDAEVQRTLNKIIENLDQRLPVTQKDYDQFREAVSQLGEHKMRALVPTLKLSESCRRYDVFVLADNSPFYFKLPDHRRKNSRDFISAWDVDLSLEDVRASVLGEIVTALADGYHLQSVNDWGVNYRLAQKWLTDQQKLGDPDIAPDAPAKFRSEMRAALKQYAATLVKPTDGVERSKIEGLMRELFPGNL